MFRNKIAAIMFLPSLSPDPPPHHPLLLFAPALSQKLESAKNIYEALPLHPAPNPQEKTTTTARMSKTNKNLNDVSRTITHTCLMLANNANWSLPLSHTHGRQFITYSLTHTLPPQTPMRMCRCSLSGSTLTLGQLLIAVEQTATTPITTREPITYCADTWAWDSNLTSVRGVGWGIGGKLTPPFQQSDNEQAKRQRARERETERETSCRGTSSRPHSRRKR